MRKSKIMPSIDELKHLQIPLRDVSLATNGFADDNLIGWGAFGRVYKGISEKHGRIAVKRWERDSRYGQGDHQFRTEIALLSEYKHENIVCLLGFCDEDGEKILVYKYESNGSLCRHLNNQDLTWTQRLKICLDIACGLKYVNDNVGSQPGIFHRDVKSPNILLDENWKAKVSDFGLSRLRPAHSQSSFVMTRVCGTPGYIDPDYALAGYLSLKSDVYSFGVVLFEVLCGRPAIDSSYNDDERRYLSVLVKKHYKRESLDAIIPSYLRKQMNTDSLNMFSNIAYQCLKTGEERPTMMQVVEHLQKALDRQLEKKKADLLLEVADLTWTPTQRLRPHGTTMSYTAIIRKEVKKPEEEAKPTIIDKKGHDSRDPTPTPPQKEIVLSMHMHCQSCAREVRRCLKGFEGVEDVVTDYETQRVVVIGEKADPLKVLERVKKKSGRNVELLSPVSMVLAKKVELEETSTLKDKENKEVQEAKMAMGDEEMVEESKGIVLNVKIALEKSEDVLKALRALKGKKADPLKVLEIVQKNFHPKVKLISPIHKQLTNDPKKPEQEKPCKQGWKSWF